jgi:hypothetical protein
LLTSTALVEALYAEKPSSSSNRQVRGWLHRQRERHACLGRQNVHLVNAAA